MFEITPLLVGFQHQDDDVAVGTDLTRIVGPDARRVILYISNSANHPLSLWHGLAIRQGKSPHYLVPAGSTVRFTWSEDGPMSTFGWRGAYQQASGQVAVVEILWIPGQIGVEV